MLKKIRQSLLKLFGFTESKLPEVSTASKHHNKSDIKNKSTKKEHNPSKNRIQRSDSSVKSSNKKKSSLAKKTESKEPKKEFVPKKRIVPKKPTTHKEVVPQEGKIRFADLAIHEDVLFGIEELDFEYCTPIQALTLPYALERRDIAGKALTGTGKTAAFLIACFTQLLNKPEVTPKSGTPRALVLAPTRELAIQIHKDAELLAKYTTLNCAVVFGGMDHEKQRQSLNDNIDILIGTPGRIIDYSRGSSLNLRHAEFLIIDEADRMLDMGFVPDVKRIVVQLPKKGDRQTMLFSATLDDSILRLAAGWLVEPVTLESEPEKMVGENIEQTFYSVSREEKLSLTLHFIKNSEFERMLIFGNRKDVNLRLRDDLARYGVDVPVLSGDIPQDKRIKILERFRNGADKIVIATDVAARGIHVDNVSLVINYDLPERAEDYVHRIGRTGRAGNVGKSISFLCEYGAYNLPAIEELLGVTFSSIQPEEEMLVMPECVKSPRVQKSSKHKYKRKNS